MIRSGAKRYDFLGGDDPYKAKFGAQQKNYLNLTFAVHPGWAARISHCEDENGKSRPG